jgi:hypothetical protein
MRKLILGAALAAATAMPASAQVAVEIEPEVREYVIQEGRASSVEFDGDIAVGTVLPPTVEFHAIPSARTYRYAVINDQRVIVDPDSRRIIEIVE